KTVCRNLDSRSVLARRVSRDLTQMILSNIVNAHYRGAEHVLNSYDALVIGGGPGGATAARLLAKAGWSVAVVEKTQFPRRKVCGEYLAPTNYPLLQQLGILDDFLQSAGPEVRRIELVLKGSTITSPMPRP